MLSEDLNFHYVWFFCTSTQFRVFSASVDTKIAQIAQSKLCLTYDQRLHALLIRALPYDHMTRRVTFSRQIYEFRALPHFSSCP